MSTILAVARAAWSSFVAAIPMLRSGKAERDAGNNPHAALNDRADNLLDGGLGRLGAISADDTHWERLANAIGGAFVRPEHFSKPHMREWISHPDTNVALRRVARARLVSAPEKTEDHEKLLSIYMEISGEHRSHAESSLFAAVSFLTTSMQAAAKIQATRRFRKLDSDRCTIVSTRFRKARCIDDASIEPGQRRCCRASWQGCPIEARCDIEAAGSRRRKTAQALALRSRIVLECATGVDSKLVAQRLSVSQQTVSKWRNRFAVNRLDGLLDAPRTGAPRTIDDARVDALIAQTLESVPKNATLWSTRSMAREMGMSQSAVSRIWRAFGLQPHRQETFKLSSNPLFVEKVRDIVGLYLDPPLKAMVLCVDEKSQIQARPHPTDPAWSPRAAHA